MFLTHNWIPGRPESLVQTVTCACGAEFITVAGLESCIDCVRAQIAARRKAAGLPERWNPIMVEGDPL